MVCSRLIKVTLKRKRFQNTEEGTYWCDKHSFFIKQRSLYTCLSTWKSIVRPIFRPHIQALQTSSSQMLLKPLCKCTASLAWTGIYNPITLTKPLLIVLITSAAPTLNLRKKILCEQKTMREAPHQMSTQTPVFKTRTVNASVDDRTYCMRHSAQSAEKGAETMRAQGSQSLCCALAATLSYKHNVATAKRPSSKCGALCSSAISPLRSSLVAA